MSTDKYEERRAPLSWLNYLARAVGPETAELLKSEGLYICGGAVRAYFLGQHPSDIDLFCRDAEVANGMRLTLGERMGEVFRTETEGWLTVTYRSPLGTPIQVIERKNRPTGQPLYLIFIVGGFDFTICKAGYDCAQGMFLLHPRFFEHLACRNLVYEGSEYPLSSLRRALKFQAKGFYLCDEMLLRIVEDIARQVDFEDEAALADHVAGMDPDGARRVRHID